MRNERLRNFILIGLVGGVSVAVSRSNNGVDRQKTKYEALERVCGGEVPGADNPFCVVTIAERVCVSEKHKDNFGVFKWSPGENSFFYLNRRKDGECDEDTISADAIRVDGCCGNPTQIENIVFERDN